MTLAEIPGASARPHIAESWRGGAESSPALLVARVGQLLAEARIRYCQWKGHAKQARWEAGESDIDLLVERADAAAFAAVMQYLGFKLALPTGRASLPGTLSYYGMDPVRRRLIHVHVHFELLVGLLWGRHYRLPIERAVLADTIERTWFRTPSPEIELLLLVLHSVLRYRARDVVRGTPYWMPPLSPALVGLEAEADRARLDQVLARQVPEVTPALYRRCRAALEPGASPWSLLAARAALGRALAPHQRRPPAGARRRRTLGLLLRLAGFTARRLDGFAKHFASGGAIIALVGTDGAGKSTCAESLERWLSPEFRTRRFHLGRPPRAALTLGLGGALKLARLLDRLRGRASDSAGTALCELLRCVGTARDRYRLYRRVRRFAAAGGIAICDRFPIPESYALAGPSTAQGVAAAARGPLAERLRRLEAGWYERIGNPDITLVLRISPDIAAARKTDEPEPYVRRRAQLLAQVDWSRPSITVIDADRPLSEVVLAVRDRVWRAL